ncbi:sugar transferase [Flavobacteriaceae bacterium S0825]|uniref:sugar transferase n=1 Tax=Gaetbulibacter sp. S0825 TaxID=2720084 RepID=UPI00143068EA|nr:sugar transferase [Gaetbulibacter sp. S0825]MCK0109703.1 sugar transferase [Flavobacteriaceae bacterium S0825]NIX65335.1 sugar transferase [Gaetbulibacter sp. S0825]
MYAKVLKPILDISSAIIGFIISSPIFLVLIVILLFTNNGKPFFYQRRAGKKGRVFNIIKLKSMNDKRDKNGDLLPYHLRVTKIGSFIRKTSLDEIPQLINVIKGDMSLVGPRPLHPEYLPLYDKEQARRHDVMPGITGWAQVNGRTSISWEQKFKHDVWYVDNQSFLLDLKILFLTIYKVLQKKDMDGAVNKTIAPFKNAQVE